MPTYEYECTRCGRITEEFKPMSAPRRQRCPHCRGRVKRLISGGLGILFKGSGFYVNDSRGKNNHSQESTPNKTESKSQTETAAAGNATKKAAQNKS